MPILSRLLSPAIKVMGKISYIQKISFILLLFLLPLGYSTSVLYRTLQARIYEVDVGLYKLETTHAFSQMLALFYDFQDAGLAHLRETNTTVSMKIGKGQKALLEIHTHIFEQLDDKTRLAYKTFYDKENFALLSADDKSFSELLQTYQHRLLNDMARLRLDTDRSSEFSLSKAAYILSVGIPSDVLLLMQMEILRLSNESRNEWLLKAGELQGSAEKNELFFDGFEASDPSLAELNNEYKVLLQNYINDELLYDPSKAGKQEKQLGNLLFRQYDLLHALIYKDLSEKKSGYVKQRDTLISILIFSLILGFYFFIAFASAFGNSKRKFFNAIDAIARGNFHSRIGSDSSDEMGELSLEFDKMAQSLETHFALLSEYNKAVDKSVMVLKTDIHGIITYVNDAYTDISGYTKEELIGSSHRLVSSRHKASGQIRELWEHILNKEVYKIVFENISKEGKVFYVESTIVPLLDHSGEISEFISIMSDISPLYKQKERLQSQLYKDDLTTLPNRRKLLEDISLTKEAKLVVINIDSFKEINSIYGEEIGDQTLQKMAKEIKHALKTHHLRLYKLSADEFAILAGEEISLAYFKEDVTMLAHYLSHVRLHVDKYEISVRLSLGAAVYTSSQLQRPLISMADMALKEAKRRMRPYMFYNDIASVDEDLEKNYKLIQLIEEAIKEDKVYCCYQGIVNARTGRIEKYEALMRLDNEKGERLSPESFVTLAKRTRYYPKLTQKIIQEAVFTFLKREESVSINLSIDDIMDDNTYALILDVLRNCGCAERIIFEFLESEEIEFNERILEFTSYVKKLGVQIAIDDFGSGYSNYAYLMKLGVDILKIDASLIKDIDKNKNSRLITQSIIDIAHDLGMKTVAEHVHTKEIEETIKSMGVDYLQGYYLHKPVCDL